MQNEDRLEEILHLHISGTTGEVTARDASQARDLATRRHGWTGIDARRNLVVRTA